MADSLDAIKGKLVAKKKKSPRTGAELRRLSTGSTLVNLGLSGQPDWGLEEGCYYLFVGDSKAGKTFIALTALAEASINPAFDGYRLIYDAPERGARMDLEKFFGPKLAKRLEWKYSRTVMEMYYSLDDCLEDGRPFIYVEDSESALSSEEEEDKFREAKNAFRKGKAATGSYGDGKAKKHSANLRTVVNKLEKARSILVMITQTRDNIGFGAQFNPKVRSGGHALTFYATGEIWFSVKGSIKRTVNGKPRKIGTEIAVKVKKNRDTGREPTVQIHHYPSHGLDDVGSCVQYLVDERAWKSSKDDGGGKITTSSDFGNLSGDRDRLAQLIQEKNLERDLRLLVTETWNEVEEACAVHRKSRYA